MKTLLILLSLSCHAGIASWYYPRTNGMVCASWQYPIGTMLRVVEANNGCQVVVRVIERGPNKRLHRDIDLSRAAFTVLDGPEMGLCEVKIERVK